jgi:hypothetical protein
MDTTFLIFFILLYIIIAWAIGFNVTYDERFNILEKKIIIGFLLIPPVGILLFILLKTKRKPKIRKQKLSNKRVYHGGYDGGHNKSRK